MKQLIFIVLLLLVACSTQTEQITIGGLHTLSGNLVDVLGGSAHGIHMAIEDFERETGIAVRAIDEDDKSCTDKTNAANKLINFDKVDAIVGTTCSSMTLSVAPMTEAAKILLVTGVSTSAAISEAGDYIFRTIPSDATKSVKVAEEIIANGYSRVGFLYANGNDAIVDGIQGVKEHLPSTYVVADEPVTDDEADFRTSLLKVMNKKPDVLVISFSDSRQFGLVMKQYDELGLAKLPTYVPIETIENDLVLEVGGKSVEGLLYPYFKEPEGAAYESFRARYKAKYGVDVPAYAAEAYDAAMITLKALAQSSSGEDAREQMFVIGNNYPGVSGTITFDETGDVHKPLVMKTIKNGAFVHA
ncbi:MAG: ABC transporter substrate-binding protein [Candidatus Woesearchaeota archaeon]|nr:ABC transporter substrate-binding protein [Candidatus Woesearchaeota archaeon]